jgi:surface antigen
MIGRTARLAAVMLLAFATALPATAQGFGSQRFQCAPFARLLSGIQLFGDAAGWWGQALGRYSRGNTPSIGAAMVFKPGRTMRVGHVATVTGIVSDRIVKVTHANWSPINGRRGRVETDVQVVDVSANNDWSSVRVWYAPIKSVGSSSHAVYGFVYPDAAAQLASRIERAPSEMLAEAPLPETDTAAATAIAD